MLDLSVMVTSGSGQTLEAKGEKKYKYFSEFKVYTCSNELSLLNARGTID